MEWKGPTWVSHIIFATSFNKTDNKYMYIQGKRRLCRKLSQYWYHVKMPLCHCIRKMYSEPLFILIYQVTVINFHCVYYPVLKPVMDEAYWHYFTFLLFQMQHCTIVKLSCSLCVVYTNSNGHEFACNHVHTVNGPAALSTNTGIHIFFRDIWDIWPSDIELVILKHSADPMTLMFTLTQI